MPLMPLFIDDLAHTLLFRYAAAAAAAADA